MGFLAVLVNEKLSHPQAALEAATQRLDGFRSSTDLRL